MSRLYSLSADPIFRRLFEAQETKIDLAKEINQPKVIVVNADRDYLRSLKELYGRYFLALLKSAGESRPANSDPLLHLYRRVRRVCKARRERGRYHL